MAFTVENKTENGFNKIILKDNNTQTFVEIIPACGAILHAFSVVQNEHFINVIDGYNDKKDFEDNAENKGFKSCKLSPFVCRVKNASYNFADKQYKLSKYILDGNALHGLLYDAPFKVVHQQANDVTAQVVLMHRYKGSDPGYPFLYDCEVTYLLKESNTLNIITKIINKDEGFIPVQDGWHPYFTFDTPVDELQLEFQSTDKFLFDKAMIPTGEKVPYQQYGSLTKIDDATFDDCFAVNFAECQPACILRDAKQKIQVELHPDKSYPYLQIYTPPHRNSIAIENLSSLPDGFNNGTGLITLASQATANFSTTYKITLLT